MLRTVVAGSVVLLLLASAPAQAAEGCPRLPAGNDLRWEQRDVPGMVFCKALSADGTEMFTVTLGSSLAFRPLGSQQVARGAIDGHRVRWYRGSDGFSPGVEVRETRLRLGRRRDAHIVVRAPSEDVLEARLQLVEGLAFEP